MLSHKVNTAFFSLVVLLLIILSFFAAIAWWVFLIPVLLWVIITGVGSAFIFTGYHIKAYCKNRDVKEKKIAITFDDGPTPETPKVLNLLKKHNAKATFFCIGSQIEKYPDIFKAILEDGHTVGNHTYSHSPKMGFFPAQKVKEELEVTNSLIEKYSGKKALFFRPPFGVTNPNIAKAVKATGHYVIGWNIRSLDTIIKSENRLLNRVKNRLAPGSIILLHDTSQKTVNVLEQLLVLLEQNKYEAITVNQLLNIPAYEE